MKTKMGNTEYSDWLSPLNGKAHLLKANIKIRGDSTIYMPGNAKKTICNKAVKKLKLKYKIEPDEEEKCNKCLKKKKKLDKKLIGDKNVAILEERTYAGLCSGASHWFGSLQIGDVSSTDLRFTLTYLQARVANKQEGISSGDWNEWEAGAESNRFFTREALRKRAVEAVKEFWPDAKAVMSGSRWSSGPCETIEIFGDNQLRDKLNEIYFGLDDDYDMDDECWFDLVKEAGLSI